MYLYWLAWHTYIKSGRTLNPLDVAPDIAPSAATQRLRPGFPSQKNDQLVAQMRLSTSINIAYLVFPKRKMAQVLWNYVVNTHAVPSSLNAPKMMVNRKATHQTLVLLPLVAGATINDHADPCSGRWAQHIFCGASSVPLSVKPMVESLMTLPMTAVTDTSPTSTGIQDQDANIAMACVCVYIIFTSTLTRQKLDFRPRKNGECEKTYAKTHSAHVFPSPLICQSVRSGSSDSAHWTSLKMLCLLCHLSVWCIHPTQSNLSYLWLSRKWLPWLGLF